MIKTFKKIFFCIIFFSGFLLWENVEAACTGSSPTWTSTPDYSSVNTCVTNASVGDTINVSSGTATWSSTLTISKGIYLIGAGSASTIITTTATPGIKYAPPVGAADNPFRLSGFTFSKSSDEANLPILEWGTRDNAPTAIGNNKLTKSRVDHCVFTAINVTSPLVWLFPGNYGVFDNNTFNAYDYAFRATDDTYGDAGWTYWGWTPGTSDAVYVENNTFNFSSPGTDDEVGTSSQGLHRWVFRYNTFDVHASSYSFFDAHGNGPGYASVQISNLYGNKFVAGSETGQIHGQRGGQSFVFFNDWQSTEIPNFKIQEEAADSNGPGPATNSITGQPQHVYNSYYFNNRVSTTGDLIDTDISDTVGLIPADNVDVWSQADWQSDGSAGVGCGTLANRPECASGCATGVGYWATDQSCSNLTDYVGASPTTPISGTLYRWSGSEWVSYYTPYTYPHPLRNEESSDTTAPASPTGLSVQ